MGIPFNEKIGDKLPRWAIDDVGLKKDEFIAKKLQLSYDKAPEAFISRFLYSAVESR